MIPDNHRVGKASKNYAYFACLFRDWIPIKIEIRQLKENEKKATYQLK